MQSIMRSAFGLLLGVALFMASFTLSSTEAVAQFIGPTHLALVNGWTDAPFTTSHASVECPKTNPLRVAS